MCSLVRVISIHALRVEGDGETFGVMLKDNTISIHALRVEGDGGILSQGSAIVGISIHALRVEGDLKLGRWSSTTE